MLLSYHTLKIEKNTAHSPKRQSEPKSKTDELSDDGQKPIAGFAPGGAVTAHFAAVAAADTLLSEGAAFGECRSFSGTPLVPGPTDLFPPLGAAAAITYFPDNFRWHRDRPPLFHFFPFAITMTKVVLSPEGYGYDAKFNPPSQP